MKTKRASSDTSAIPSRRVPFLASTAGREATPSSYDALTAFELISRLDAFQGAEHNEFKVAIYTSWLRANERLVELYYAVLFNLGVLYALMGQSESAKTCYAQALAIRPDFYQAAINLGTLQELSDGDDRAIATWTRALQSPEARILLLNNRGRVYENKKQYDKAEKDFLESLILEPKQPAVLHHLVGLRTKTCSWPIHLIGIPGVSEDDMRDATRALTVLALHDDLETQTAGNLSWIGEKYPPVGVTLSPPDGYGHKKIRIGYLSSDFCEHPIAYLTTELFETHDRDRFEVFGFCSTPGNYGTIRDRLSQAFDQFHSVLHLSDETVAQLIRSLEIDILIDLNGLTLGTRLNVLRWKPAPLQMTYLGYNGPVPLPELDHIIADAFVIPPDQADRYSPPPLYVNPCFQVNDTQQRAATNITRATVGLPEDKFVFCCFSNTYKITEDMFAVWADILVETPNAILWLFIDNVYALANIKAVARANGLADDRIVFAERSDPMTYRAKLALADLFLDTFPYNAGTTASDALRAGLPILTLCGATFISRMAASLLSSMGLAEGITHSMAEYAAAAKALASSPALYTSYKDKVTLERWLGSIGDTAAFRESYEAALVTALDKRTSGKI